MNKLIIIGASGHGKVCADIASKMNKWDEIVFLDDNEKLESVMGFKVIGSSNQIKKYIGTHDFFVGVGNNSIRESIQEDLIRQNAKIATLIHPNAIIGLDVEIGRGTCLMAGVVINCSTTIKQGVIINTGTTVDHDCLIEDYVHLSPGVNVAGSVSVGKKSWFGVGSSIINNILVCDNCIIGAGGVVVNDIGIKGKYIGIPARRID